MGDIGGGTEPDAVILSLFLVLFSLRTSKPVCILGKAVFELFGGSERSAGLFFPLCFSILIHFSRREFQGLVDIGLVSR